MNSGVARQKVAVVSGGSSGIGLELVAALSKQGYRVLTCGRDAAKLQRLEQKVPGVTGYICDVSDREAVRRLAATVLAEYPAIDVLISNAGGLREIDFAAPDLDSVDLTAELRINLEGAIHLIAAFTPGLRRAAPASILVVSSGYALAPATRAPVYSASKAALHSLCKSLRIQLKPLRISVTELLPPLVDTPAVAHRQGKKLSAEAVASAALKGMHSGAKEVCPGDVRLLPFLLRVLPNVAEGIVAKT
ncbi:MAG: SDR family oxidoreductase [Steroidobacteraceae bacterium]